VTPEKVAIEKQAIPTSLADLVYGNIIDSLVAHLYYPVLARFL
jgi:hypothetical protein